jgi:hypothetical protein
MSLGADSLSVLALALGVDGSAAVPPPLASSLMPLRRPHQAPELRLGLEAAIAVDRPPRSRERVGGVLSAAASRGSRRP